jgi:hypothetical protein
MEYKTLKEQYYDLVLDKIIVSLEDLNETEKTIIDTGYYLMIEKLEDIKLLTEENYRLKIEIANLKSYQDDNDYNEEED